MKNKRKLKQKFRNKQILFWKQNIVNKDLHLELYRSWGKKKWKLQWESWTLTSDKVVEINIDDSFLETKEC